MPCATISFRANFHPPFECCTMPYRQTVPLAQRLQQRQPNRLLQECPLMRTFNKLTLQIRRTRQNPEVRVYTTEIWNGRSSPDLWARTDRGGRGINPARRPATNRPTASARETTEQLLWFVSQQLSTPKIMCLGVHLNAKRRHTDTNQRLNN